MTARDQYRSLCAGLDVPIHLQHWWLDAVYGPDQWEVAIATDGGGNIQGALPYQINRRRGISVIQSPPLTNYGGPVLVYNPDIEKKERIYAFEQRVVADLLRQMPSVSWFSMPCWPAFSNALPFHWAGYTTQVRYTYILNQIPQPSVLAEQLNKGVRKKIKKAARMMVFEPTSDADLVFQLLEQATRRKHLTGRYDRALFQRIHQALLDRQQCRMWVALDRVNRQPLAALYLMYDQRRAHILFTGIDAASETSGGVYGLIWTAILWCHERQLTLDFEGSMDKGVEKVLRSFGGELTPYLLIRKSTWWLGALMALRR